MAGGLFIFFNYLVALLGTSLMRTLSFYLAGMAKPFQVARPKVIAHFRDQLDHFKVWSLE